MAPFRVGIDSYCLTHRKWDPFTLMDWVRDRGGEGVQFSEVHLPPGREVDKAFLAELANAFQERGMYLEWGGGQHVPFDTGTWEPKDLLPGNRLAAEQARALGTDVVRSCSGGFFRWSDRAPPTETLIEAMAAALRPQRPIFEDLGVTLAIELHFEFTTFELIRLFDMCDADPGGWLGICLDTFNMLPMLEDPVLGTERALPWVVATHVKDGGVALDDGRLLTFPTEVGRGLVDFQSILELLAGLGRPINLSVEDHGGSFTTLFFDEGFLSRFPDLDTDERNRLIAAARAGGARLETGELSITERADWPGMCEERTQRGMEHIQRLVRGMGEGPA